MTTDATEMLAKLTAGQDDLKAGQVQIVSTLGKQTEILRLIAEQLSLVLGKLTPQVGEGPTLQELLAELVARVGDNGALLRRIDRRTESMAMTLPDDVVRVMKAVIGANGNSGNGRGAANGSAGQ
jgi:hypothetical protein